MGIYFSNRKDYYLMTMHDMVDMIQNKFDFDNEESLLKIKRRQEYELPEGEQFFCINTEEITKVRDTLREYAGRIISDNRTANRATKFEAPEPLTPEQMERAQTQFINWSSDYLSTVNEIDSLSHEDENGLQLKFQYNQKQQEEKLKFGEIVTSIPVDINDLNAHDRDMLKSIKKNVFFRNMTNEIDKIEFVKCDAVDKDNLCVRIPLRETNLIMSQEEAQEYLDKYNRNEKSIDHRKKPTDLELA